MITRRDALRLAASLPIVAPALALSARDVAAALDRPLSAPPKTPEGQPGNLYDPVSFAETLDGRWDCDAGPHMAPEALAEMQEAFHNLYQAVSDPAITRLIDELSDASFGYGTAMQWGGLRAGAAYEHLRIALLSPTMSCPDCHGSYNGGFNRAGCTRCGGRGVVATPGVVVR